jgi:hypothetical protein
VLNKNRDVSGREMSAEDLMQIRTPVLR